MGVLLVCAALAYAVMHTTRKTGPRAARAVAASRRKSIDAWKAANPNARVSSRWVAAAARWITALRWAPKHIAAEWKAVWQESYAAGRARYGLPAVKPVAEAETEQFDPWDHAEPISGPGTPMGEDEWPDLYDPNDTAKCPECGGVGVIDGRPCPRCLATQQARNAAFDNDPTVRHLRPVPFANARSSSMPIDTVTGGEIKDAELFKAEADAIAREAAADLEDATADAQRAGEDLARIENMVNTLRQEKALSADIASVSALLEPAQMRAQAARDRQAAAEKRLAGAQEVQRVAAKHVQLIGTAAGAFYKAG